MRGTLVCGDRASLDGQETTLSEDLSGSGSVSEESQQGEIASYRVIGARVPPGNPYSPPARFVFYQLDHLGSVRAVLDASANLVSTHSYLPFGEERPNLPEYSLNDRFFTGHERDKEIGLDYMVARYYGSSLGRFQSPDPGVDIQPEDPQSWNMYTYVRNNPLNRTDPDGRKASVDGSNKKDRKANFKKLKEKLKQNGASKKELRSLKLNKKTGKVTQKGGAINNASPAFSSFQDVVGDDNNATYHFVAPDGAGTARDGTSYSYSFITDQKHGCGGGCTIADRSGDTNPAGGVDVEIFVAEGGEPGGIPSASNPSVPTADPDNLIAAHETREAYEHMSSSAPLPAAHYVAVEFENQLRDSLGFARRAP